MSQDRVLLSSEEKFQKRILVVRAAMQQGTQQAAVRFGLSERTVRSWKARFKARGVGGLKDQSRAAKHVWNKKDRDGVLEKALRKLHEDEPGLNRVQVLGKLLGEPSKDLPTISWIARTRNRLGLAKKKKQKKNEHKKRYEIPIPGALQVDTKYVKKENGEDIYQFTAIDECSRVRFLGGSIFKSAACATKFIKAALDFYEGLGVRVWRVQTDRGTEFTRPATKLAMEYYAAGKSDDSLFTQELNSRNIRHRLIKPRTPQLNGKVERSHRIDNERFYSRFSFTDSLTLDHALKNLWMPEYNEQRPHGSLGYQTPMEFLKKRLKELDDKKLKEIRSQYEQTIAA